MFSSIDGKLNEHIKEALLEKKDEYKSRFHSVLEANSHQKRKIGYFQKKSKSTRSTKDQKLQMVWHLLYARDRIPNTALSLSRTSLISPFKKNLASRKVLS